MVQMSIPDVFLLRIFQFLSMLLIYLLDHRYNCQIVYNGKTSLEKPILLNPWATQIFKKLTVFRANAYYAVLHDHISIAYKCRNQSLSSSSKTDTLIFEHFMYSKWAIFTEMIFKTISIIIISRIYILKWQYEQRWM